MDNGKDIIEQKQHNIRSVEELMNDLENNEKIKDSFGEYIIETTIKKNNQDWCYYCFVYYNKEIIYLDKDLGADEVKTNAEREDNLKFFIKKAAKNHILKCENVIARLPRPERKINMKRLISISISVCLVLALTACIVLYLDKIKSKPTGKIDDIKKDSCYKRGEDIKFTMIGKGDGITKMIFKLNDDSLPDIVVETTGEGKYIPPKKHSFPTISLKEGVHKYSFIVENKDGERSMPYEGTFEICNEQKTTVTVLGIEKSYIEEGDVKYSITVSKGFSVVSFEVRDSNKKKVWSSPSEQGSFSTKGWQAGTYQYIAIAKDSSQNRVEAVGSFIISEKPDTEKPTVKIFGIKNSYIEGETVIYKIEATDNRLLSLISFEIKNSHLNKKVWNVGGNSAVKQDSFSTKAWNAGDYRYVVIAEDSSQNRVETAGIFMVSEKPDTEKPTVKVSGIQSFYTEGDTVTCSIKATDNKSLSLISFEVKNSPVNEKWNISGNSFVKPYSFSTKDWKPGNYQYIAIAEDSSQNSSFDKPLSFELYEKKKILETGKLTIVTTPYTFISINGEDKGITPKTLTLPSGKITIKLINKEKNIDKLEMIDIQGGGHTQCSMDMESIVECKVVHDNQ